MSFCVDSRSKRETTYHDRNSLAGHKKISGSSFDARSLHGMIGALPLAVRQSFNEQDNEKRLAFTVLTHSFVCYRRFRIARRTTL